MEGTEFQPEYVSPGLVNNHEPHRNVYNQGNDTVKIIYFYCESDTYFVTILTNTEKYKLLSMFPFISASIHLYKHTGI